MIVPITRFTPFGVTEKMRKASVRTKHDKWQDTAIFITLIVGTASVVYFYHEIKKSRLQIAMLEKKKNEEGT